MHLIGHSSVNQIFIDEYPELLGMFCEFATKMDEYTQFTKMSQSDNDHVSLTAAVASPTNDNSNTQEQEEWIQQLLDPCEKQYLNNSFKRLSEKLNYIFSKVKPPLQAAPLQAAPQQQQQQQYLYEQSFVGISLSDIRSFSAAIVNELHLARNDARLIALVAKNVARALRQFLVEMESKIINSDTMVLDEKNLLKCTVYEKFNANIFNSVCKLHSAIQQSILDNDVHAILDPLLQALNKQGNDILQPYFDDMLRLLQRALLAQHTLDYAQITYVSFLI